MALIERPQSNGKRTSYLINFQYLGKDIWKTVGYDKRAAERLHQKLKDKEARKNFVEDAAPSKFVKVGDWFDQVFNEHRKGRAANGERQQIRDHVMSLEWFRMMRVCDVDAATILKVIKAVRESGKLAEPSITNIHSVMSSVFQWAVFFKLLETNPCRDLPAGIIIRGAKKTRDAYTRTEARTLMECREHRDAVRMFLYLAFYTGMREGEIVGLRWQDWIVEGEPYGAIHIHGQYEGAPLKGDDHTKVRPRWVPVHKALRVMLEYWWETGWELVHCRQPKLSDYIVPTSSGQCQSRSSAYRAFRTALRQAKVPNKSLHSTRHTFISVIRAGTERHDMVERITHNAKGTTLDDYTHAEWGLLCKIMDGVDYSVDRAAKAGFLGGGGPKRRGDSEQAAAEPAPLFETTVGHSTVITHDGQSLTVTAWEAVTGIPRKTIADRLNNGWSIERALSTPIDLRKVKRYGRNNLKELAKLHGDPAAQIKGGPDSGPDSPIKNPGETGSDSRTRTWETEGKNTKNPSKTGQTGSTENPCICRGLSRFGDTPAARQDLGLLAPILVDALTWAVETDFDHARALYRKL